MARVIYGSMITELIGSIGGLTFQKNTSGAICRLKPATPVNPSLIQSERQLALIRFVEAWGGLSLAQKTVWNDLAAAHTKINDWGNYVKISGYQWFLSYNLNAFTQGDQLWTFPNVYELVPPPDQFIIVPSANSLILRWPISWAMPGQWCGLYATGPMKQTSVKLRKATFFLGVFQESGITEYDITEVYESFFNIVWSEFYESAQAAIIVRLKNFYEDGGYASPFTSNVVMIGGSITPDPDRAMTISETTLAFDTDNASPCCISTFLVSANYAWYLEQTGWLTSFGVSPMLGDGNKLVSITYTGSQQLNGVLQTLNFFWELDGVDTGLSVTLTGDQGCV